MIKVLIVEDDPMVAELNSHYLQQIEGFVLAGVASNGLAALDFLKETEVNLILLDIFMPRLNGLELLNQIRTAGHGVDIIMVTAARDSVSIQNSLRQGVVDYLVKPFQFERLYAALVAYRERIHLIRQQVVLNQDEIDHQILSKGDLLAGELPKGLDHETLNLVLEHVKSCTTPFTTEEMAGHVGMSRVSVSKYLKFLKKIGVLAGRLTYQSAGRPVNMYSYTKREITY